MKPLSDSIHNRESRLRPVAGKLWTPENTVHGVIITSTLVHLLLALFLPLGFHETHYASYGFRPDLSYVDHPPLVGWLQALPVYWSGSDLAVRMVPLLLTMLSLYMLAWLTRDLYPNASPWLAPVAVLILQGSAIVHAGFTMVPEVPLLTLGIAAAWLTIRVIRNDRWSDWLALGVVLGLAGLAKYTAASLALSLPLALLVFGKGRYMLRPRLWVAALVALIVVSPVVIWNFQNDWLSLAHQYSYQLGTQVEESIGWDWGKVLKAHAIQLAAYSPLLCLGAIPAIYLALRKRDPGARLLLAFALPLLLLFFLVSGYTRGRAHWSLLAWVLLAPLVARWLVATWEHRAVRIFTWVSGLFSLTALLAAVSLTLPVWRFTDHAHPYGEIYGWPEAGARAAGHAARLTPDADAKRPAIFALKWHHAEPLAWYTREAPSLPVKAITPDISQYVYWFGVPSPGDSGILVIPQYKPSTPPQPPAAYGCSLIEEWPYHHGATLVSTFRYYRCGP